MTKRIRVLIVDDSAVMRTLLTQLISSDPEIEVVGSARDAFSAREKLVALNPDVMTLDVEMPGMDGVTFLGKVMEHFPVRTVIISSLTTEGAEMSLKALELGAIDVISKPATDLIQNLSEKKTELISRVKVAAQSRLHMKRNRSTPAAKTPDRIAFNTGYVIAMAASTGGTEALMSVLSQFPAGSPPILVVQHMPAAFTQYFAIRLQQSCGMRVKVAAQGEVVMPGTVFLAPGGNHMEIVRRGPSFEISLNDDPPMHGVKPAADYLMNSFARLGTARAIGVILTGMGRDGSQGLLAMKNSGSFNIAQDEETSLVFGMPKEAIKLGAVHVTLPLNEIASAVLNRIIEKSKKAG